MTATEAIRFWLGFTSSEAGRDAVRVLLDNAPRCQYMLDTMEMREPERRCNNIACRRFEDRWLCDQHEGV